MAQTPTNEKEATTIDPLYVSCHLCHAQVGEPCKAWARRGRAGYCSRRVTHAQRYQGGEVDVEHGLVHGERCTPHSPGSILQDVCTQCGQSIPRLQSIPTLLANPLENDATVAVDLFLARGGTLDHDDGWCLRQVEDGLTIGYGSVPLEVEAEFLRRGLHYAHQDVDVIAGIELYCFIRENRLTEPGTPVGRRRATVERRLRRFMGAGQYNPLVAIKAWTHVAKAAAKVYGSEYDAGRRAGLQTFPPKTRVYTAARLAAKFESEIEAEGEMERVNWYRATRAMDL